MKVVEWFIIAIMFVWLVFCSIEIIRELHKLTNPLHFVPYPIVRSC